MDLRNIYRCVVALEKVVISEDSVCFQVRINTTAGVLGVWDVPESQFAITQL